MANRYTRYTTDAISLLKSTQDRAANTPALEMTRDLLLQSFLSGNSELRSRLLKDNSFEVIGLETSSDSPAEARPKVMLSAELRQDLDHAEAHTTERISSWHLLSEIWPHVQQRLIDLLRHSDGRTVSTPVALPERPEESPGPDPPGVTKSRPLTGLLARYGRDLTASVGAGTLVGREQELAELTEILLKLHKPNAVLLGDPGVGKTAIVEGLAERIRTGDVPAVLRGKRIVELPVSAMVADTTLRGQFEERLRRLITEAEDDSSIILFIDELHMLVGAGVNTDAQGDAADLLKPALARGRIRLIGATTWNEYYESIDTDPALRRRLTVIRVDEPSSEAVGVILATTLPRILAHHQLQAEQNVVPLVISLCTTELPTRRFPDKAIDVLDQACSRAAREHSTVLKATHIRAVIAKLSGVTNTTDSVEFNERLASLEVMLKNKVLRQDDAVDKVSQVVRLCKRRLDLRTQRPDGVFLFVGPTGVGKTELAKALAEALYGSQDRIIRLDMTAFRERHTVATLLGSPSGYIGYGTEPAWLEQLRKIPAAILLLDELEKAHSDVLNVFLRAFDEGEIVDARGNEYSLANVTVIATSNAAVNLDGGTFGFHESAVSTHRDWMNGLQKYFPPEFLNRFDEIVPFEPLTTADLGVILRDKLLPEASQKLLETCRLRLTVTDAGRYKLAELCKSDLFGARELERVLTRNVLVPATTIAGCAHPSKVDTTDELVVDLRSDGELSLFVRPAHPSRYAGQTETAT